MTFILGMAYSLLLIISPAPGGGTLAVTRAGPIRQRKGCADRADPAPSARRARYCDDLGGQAQASKKSSRHAREALLNMPRQQQSAPGAQRLFPNDRKDTVPRSPHWCACHIHLLLTFIFIGLCSVMPMCSRSGSCTVLYCLSPSCSMSLLVFHQLIILPCRSARTHGALPFT